MGRVSGRDYEGILEVLAMAASGSSAEPIPVPALAAIRRLIPADVVAFFEGPPWDRGRRRVWVDGDHATWTPEEKAIMDRLRFQLPLWPTPATLGRALRITDVMSLRAYRQLELYRLIGRPHQVEYSLAFWMDGPDGVIRGLTFDAADRDFRVRDKDVLAVLGRHLGVMLGRNDPRLPRSSTALGITGRQATVLALVARGRTNAEIAFLLSVSPNTVRKHLENAYRRMKVNTRAEAIVAAYRANGAGPEDRIGLS
jgi:DNA-binding CsgD family transcriptional regulator